ncbi:MAG: hypothetical protein Q4B09_00005, partial [Lachnospiraceae bacterium]|nr:hypothetical protein [Lachnospiraceae bacterium]
EQKKPWSESDRAICECRRRLRECEAWSNRLLEGEEHIKSRGAGMRSMEQSTFRRRRTYQVPRCGHDGVMLVFLTYSSGGKVVISEREITTEKERRTAGRENKI